jgi:hypothetical protein
MKFSILNFQFLVNLPLKCKSVSISKLLVYLIFLYFLFSLLKIDRTFAQEMSSQNFKIQGGNFNMTSGEKSSTNFKLSDVVGQTAAGIFASKGYIIQAGFLNGAAGEVFSFTVLPPVIDFGTLFPNMPIEKTLTIKIENGNVPGYLVKVSENQPLSTSVGSEIPDTACDKAEKPCTPSQASEWIKNTTYGFGYQMSGITVPAEFANKNYFRPFPATRRNEQAALIMQSKARKVKDEATMTLKLNISKEQPVGVYKNVISFTAIAGI